MTSEQAELTCQTPAERRNARRYRYEILAAAATYCALTIISVRVVDQFHGSARVGVALLPIIGVLLMVAALVRFGLRMDELQRQTVLGACAVSLIFTVVVTMVLGFLENAGLPRLSMTYVWPIAAIAWGIALPFVRRRFV